jgi:putative aminopeptidase FrvX
VPCRYIHSPTAYLHRDDYANTLRLVQAALHAFPSSAFASSAPATAAL